MAERIRRASALYPDVLFSDDVADFAAGICSELGVDGYRGDITLMRTARAAAALEGRSSVSRDDVLLAARFVLPHRMKKLPFEDMGLTETMLNKAAAAQPQEIVVNVQPQEDEEEDEDRDEKKATGQPASRSCPCMKSR